MSQRRRVLAVLGAAVLAIAAAVVPATAASAATTYSVFGTFQSEVGCPSDWSPSCADTQLALQGGGFMTVTVAGVPAGTWEYKIAQTIDGSAGDVYPVGPNLTFTSDGGDVTFYFDPMSHYATTSANGPIIVVPGNHQSELGCSGDWQPDCVYTWLIDPDGDGTYTQVTNGIPTGSYAALVAHNLSWTESYGLGGVPGVNIPFSTTIGQTVTFSYVLETHILTITVGDAAVAPGTSATLPPTGAAPLPITAGALASLLVGVLLLRRRSRAS